MINYRGFYIHEQDEEFHIYLCKRHFTESKKPFASYTSEYDAKYAIDDIMQSYPIVQVKYPATGEWGDFVSIKDETDLYYGTLMCDGIHGEFRGEYRILSHIPRKIPRRVTVYPDELRDY